AAALLAFAGVGVAFDPPRHLSGAPAGLWSAYPLLVAVAALGYARLARHRPSLLAAAACLTAWLIETTWREYGALRRVLAGLDAIALGMAFFVLAALISLGKGGVLGKWFEKLVATTPPPGPE